MRYGIGVVITGAVEIAGRASPPGKQMGHAGAIVTDRIGAYSAKRKALEQAGVVVADAPREIPEVVSRRLTGRAPARALGVCATATVLR